MIDDNVPRIDYVSVHKESIKSMGIFFIIMSFWLTIIVSIVLYEVRTRKKVINSLAQANSMAQIDEHIKECEDLLKDLPLYDKVFIDVVLGNKMLWEEVKEERNKI